MWAFGFIFIRDAKIDPDDWLDTSGDSFFVKLHHSEQVAPIRDRDSRHAVGSALMHQRGNANCAVNQRVFRVDVQMYERG
jgi:hypothetical protein